ncbi:MAG: DinB family protein [Candidatus Bathyarchaeota archaeon]|nr:DinB family protein [Candidatus Bathyarchaeota archaeon]
METIDLVRYNHAVRELYLEALSKLSWTEIVKPRGLSFDSARDVFLHLTLVEDRWINYVLPNRFSEWKDPGFETYQNIESLKEYAQHVKNQTEIFLKTLKLNALQQKVTLPWGNKPDTQITVETILTHMVMEDMVHYGELSAMLWQMNLQAPYFAFWRFKHEGNSKKAS